MAVIIYKKGEHPGGFIGARVATTVGEDGLYRQKYFSANQYPDYLARATAFNNQCRKLAKAFKRHRWLNVDTCPSYVLAKGLRLTYSHSHIQPDNALPLYVTVSINKAKKRHLYSRRLRSETYREQIIEAVDYYLSIRDIEEEFREGYRAVLWKRARNLPTIVAELTLLLHESLGEDYAICPKSY